MKYCPFCGKELKEQVQCSCDESVSHNLHKKKIIKNALVFGGIAVAVILTIILIVALAGGSKEHSKIDPFDYVQISFDGYDKQGRIVVEYDEAALIDAAIGDCPDSDNEEDIAKWFAQYLLYEEGINYSCSPSNNLSNGDIVTIVFEVSDAVSNKIKSSTREYTVVGLKETTALDIFSEIDLKFTGISGDAYATIEYLSEPSILYNCYFDITPQFDLSSGDKVTVTLSEGDLNMLLNEYNIVPVETSKTYGVPELPRYVKEPQEFSKDILTQFADQFLSDRKEIADEGYITYTNFQYHGTFWMTKKETAPFWVSENTRLEFVVSYDSYLYGSYWQTTYMSLSFTDVVINPDGTLEIAYEDGNVSTFSYTNRKENFDIVKIIVD